MGVNVGESDFVVALAAIRTSARARFSIVSRAASTHRNWPGKTVTRAEGGFVFGGRAYKLVDLPGTYSLLATSADEEVARDFLCSCRPDVTGRGGRCLPAGAKPESGVAGTGDHRPVVVCLNLMDEAHRRGTARGRHHALRRIGRARGGDGGATEGRHRRACCGGSMPWPRDSTSVRPRREAVLSFPLKHVLDDLSGTVAAAFPGLTQRALGRPCGCWTTTSGSSGPSRPANSAICPATRSRKSTRQDRGPAPGAVAGAAAGVLAKADELRWQAGPDFHQSLIEGIYVQAAAIADRAVQTEPNAARRGLGSQARLAAHQPLDRLRIMILMLAVVLWLTVVGANILRACSLTCCWAPSIPR